MESHWSFVSVVLVALVACAHGQTSYFRRTYYNPIAAPATHYYQHNHAVLPAAYHNVDLASEESKHRETSPKRYSKKAHYHPYESEEEKPSSERYSSGEYSNEAHSYNSEENDSREYTIGTQIRVQHPISITKKPSHSKGTKYSSSNLFKDAHSSSSFGDLNHSIEGHDPRPPSSKKHAHKYTEIFEPYPIHVVSPPKHISPSALGSAGYSVYEPDEQDYEITSSPSGRTKAQLRERFKGVASKKQIEKYLEDQQKLLDEALKLQLLNNPKFKSLLKSKGREYFEDQQYEHELPPEPLPTFRSNFEDGISIKNTRPRRRPHASEPRPPKIIKSGISSKPRRFRSAVVINV